MIRVRILCNRLRHFVRFWTFKPVAGPGTGIHDPRLIGEHVVFLVYCCVAIVIGALVL